MYTLNIASAEDMGLLMMAIDREVVTIREWLDLHDEGLYYNRTTISRFEYLLSLIAKAVQEEES